MVRGSTGRELGPGEVEDVGCDRIQSRLAASQFKFCSGDVYCYRGVPVERYEGLLAADSKGKYVRAHILNRYAYQRIHAAFRTAS